MKRLLTLGVIALFLVMPIQSFAQDTMVIYATPNNLNDVINADTLSNGARAHHIYKLVSLDTTYKFAGTITSDEDITIIGEVDPSTGRPPCIQPAVLEDGSIPGTMITLTGNNTNCTFKNLYLLAIATNNTANGGGVAIQVSADNLRLTVDNCVFDGWQTFAIGYNGNWDDFFISNSNFRNMVHPNQWYIGEVIRNEWPGEAYTDTLSMVGNTMLCVNGYASCPVTKYYETYFEFVGNRVLYTFKNPFFIFNVTKGKINENVFYGNYAGGTDQAENPWWDNLWNPDTTFGVVAFEPLSLANAKMFCPDDSSNADIATIAESRREIEVKNNVYYWPDELVNFWSTWNSTQSNTIVTPMWMNEPTIAMFADNATWPGLEESGNVNSDPGYGASLDDQILHGTSGNDVGLLKYFEEIRTGTAATDVWGYAITQVSGDPDWTPIWPLPEMAEISTMVEKLTQPSVPLTMELKEIYPNPFNPSTNIKYTLSESGNVSLKIYNMLGQEMMTLVDNVFQNASTYKVNVDMVNFSSGVYFAVLKQGDAQAVRKMMLLK
ncbi:MAG: T9SS type A sorting domain-containing protein [Calditrichaeota bacterium]|nr:T9SS type A sorting domain-containing protein [Calditrichota bacterium]